MRMYSTTEAANFLKVNRSTVVRWIRRGKLPAETEKQNGQKTYRISELTLIELQISRLQQDPRKILDASIISLLNQILRCLSSMSQRQLQMLAMLQHNTSPLASSLQKLFDI